MIELLETGVGRSIRTLDRMKSRNNSPVIENPVTKSRSTTPENKKMGPTKGISRSHTIYSQIFLSLSRA